jgi:hypothetical protein
VRKALPWRAPTWRYHEHGLAGNIVVSDNAHQIVQALQKTSRPVIVVDDFQYLMANEFMRRAKEKGYEKFTEIGHSAWLVLQAATALGGGKRVYVLTHTQTGDDGVTRMKTIGKMLDDKVVPEGLVPICLKAVVADGEHYFATRNSGHDTVKTPIGLFEDDLIPNDLAMVDSAIAAYYQQ